MIQAKREWATRTLVCLRSFSNFSLFVMSDLFLMDGYLEPQHSKKQIVSSFIMICWIFIHWVNGPHFLWIRNYPGTPWPCLWWVWVRPGWARDIRTLWACDIIMVIIIAIYQYKRLVLLWSEIFSCCGDLIVFLISSKTLIGTNSVLCGAGSMKPTSIISVLFLTCNQGSIKIFPIIITQIIRCSRKRWRVPSVMCTLEVIFSHFHFWILEIFDQNRDTD